MPFAILITIDDYHKERAFLIFIQQVSVVHGETNTDVKILRRNALCMNFKSHGLSAAVNASLSLGI